MNVGTPQREIYVEPLELPEPLRHDPPPREEPVADPVPVEPEKEPEHV